MSIHLPQYQSENVYPYMHHVPFTHPTGRAILDGFIYGRVLVNVDR